MHALHCAARCHPHHLPDPKPPMRSALTIACLCLGLGAAPLQAAPASVYLQELSSSEVHDAIQAGQRTLIIPVGGTEQNGPHMALGKHNFRAHVLAGRIAAELGNALVAPVLAYVPEGRISPPTEHMRYAGTISIPEEAFKAVLDGAARSFAQHGFTDIVLIGDSGNYQAALRTVADGLNRSWKGGPARAHYIAQYYSAGQQPFIKLLRERGLSDAQIGTHAGAADTALMLAVDANRVRPEKMTPGAAGVSGDPKRASAELGRLGTDLIVQQSVASIRAATSAPR
jgi:creatinine amidohydrolase/Fe(II)-dependent formamide hydrolase-like protein